MRKIKLTQNRVALVSDEDFEDLNQFKWYTMKRRNTSYAYRYKMTNGKQMKILMHIQIMQTPKRMETDHRDLDGLNNQRSNLRICTPSENRMNRGRQKNNTSGYKGVFWCEPAKKWRAQIAANRKTIHLGLFTDKQVAYKVYITACQKLHKEFANY